jgi:hypothetical protein
MSDDFQTELKFLGIGPSPIFVRQPEGNGYIERFVRTLKEQLLRVRRFRDLEGLLRISKSQQSPRVNTIPTGSGIFLFRVSCEKMNGFRVGSIA